MPSQLNILHTLHFTYMSFLSGLQSNPMAVSRGVSQPDNVNEEPPDLFSEEEASSTTVKSNGVHSDDDNDLFAG